MRKKAIKDSHVSGPVSTFAINFETAAYATRIEKSTMVALFYEHMPKDLKNKLALDKASYVFRSDYYELKRICIQLDDQGFHLRQANTPQTPAPQQHATSQHVNFTPPHNSGPRGPVDAAEKKRRQDNGLCAYCGGPHLLPNCDALAKREKRLNNLQLGRQLQSQTTDPDTAPPASTQKR